MPKATRELNFVSEQLQKMGISSKVLFEEDTEDAGLLVIIHEADKNYNVSREEIVSKLRA